MVNVQSFSSDTRRPGAAKRRASPPATRLAAQKTATNGRGFMITQTFRGETTVHLAVGGRARSGGPSGITDIAASASGDRKRRRGRKDEG